MDFDLWLEIGKAYRTSKSVLIRTIMTEKRKALKIYAILSHQAELPFSAPTI